MLSLVFPFQRGSGKKVWQSKRVDEKPQRSGESDVSQGENKGLCTFFNYLILYYLQYCPALWYCLEFTLILIVSRTSPKFFFDFRSDICNTKRLSLEREKWGCDIFVRVLKANDSGQARVSGAKYNIKWRKIKQASSYSNVTKRCNLCLWVKYFIICKPEMANELSSCCTHVRKFLLKNVTM